MRPGIGIDVLMIMVLSVMAFDICAADPAQKDAIRADSMMRAEKQLKDLQITYGLDNAVMPSPASGSQAANQR
ncbi:MAG: hypothetical protein PHS46_00040 [Candidatus Omnitrophica bacterium]|nr:hypothetical protein [Candidatus Omnitrophota bacterium]